MAISCYKKSGLLRHSPLSLRISRNDNLLIAFTIVTGCLMKVDNNRGLI